MPTPEELQAQLTALQAQMAAMKPPSALSLNAPDSVTAGQIRNFAAFAGGLAVASGYLTKDQLAPVTGDLIQLLGILGPVLAGIWSYLNKVRVSKTIVSANQQPAAADGTPIATIVASASAHADTTPSIVTNPAGVSVVKQP